MGDVAVVGTGTDVQTSAGADYQGSLTTLARIRLTDLRNCAPAGCFGPYTKAATTTEVDFGPLPLSCFPVGDPNTAPGGTCSVATTVNSVSPGAVAAGKRTIVQVFRLRVNDQSNALFAQQRIYVP